MRKFLVKFLINFGIICGNRDSQISSNFKSEHPQTLETDNSEKFKSKFFLIIEIILRK